MLGERELKKSKLEGGEIILVDSFFFKKNVIKESNDLITNISLKIIFPKSNLSQESEEVEIDISNPIVIIGANGAGKTRLSVSIEKRNSRLETYRIAAHKNLEMPEEVNPLSEEKALNTFRKGDYRYKIKPATGIQQDFDSLIQYLLAENANKASEYKDEMRHSKEYIFPPETKLDQVKQLWNSILGEIRKCDSKQKTSSIFIAIPGTDKEYNATEMSDGERVIFYFIAKCICAPKGSLIIVDEPEQHIHLAIRTKLWDAIEDIRNDCVFLYLTHDLDFATSRKNAKKICINKYDGKNWEWFEIPESQEIPEEIFLRILGSRQPILFVEGEKESLDCSLYNLIYPDHTIIPLGSCRKVIQATKEFNNDKLKNFHHKKAYGLIDRDHRSDSDIEELEKNEIFCLPVAEIENIFLNEKFLEEIIGILKLEGHNNTDSIDKIKHRVLGELKEKKDSVVVRRVSHRIKKLLEKFKTKNTDLEGIQDSFQKTTSFEVKNLYSEEESNISNILSKNDYEGALRVFNDKKLFVDIKKYINGIPDYRKFIEQTIKRNPRSLEVIKNSLPKF